MLLLPPPLADLLDALEKVADGQAHPDAARQSLTAARAFVQTGARLLEEFSPGLLRTPWVQELLNRARDQKEAQLHALEAVETAMARGRIPSTEALRTATARIQETLRELEAEELKGQTFSPYSELDRFLKVGRNVLDGHVPSRVLQDDFRIAASLVGRMRAATGRFAILHDRPDLVSRAEAALADLEGGLGAATDFLTKGRTTSLEDCLRMVGPASVEAHQALGLMEVWAAQHSQHARHILVEDLHRARQRELPPSLLQRLWEELELAVETESGRLEALRRHPLRLLAGLEVDGPAFLLERARLDLQQARVAGLSLADLPALDVALHSLREALAAQARRLERATHPVQEAPLLQEMQVAVGRAMQGQLGPVDFQAALDHFRNLQGDLSQSLRQSSGLLDPEDEGRLNHLLMQQVAAGHLMAAWCQDGEHQHLDQGWTMLAATAPGMVELHRRMRQRLQVGSTASSTTPCLRCGAANPRQARYCQSCSAILPVQAQGPTEYTDITGGDQAPSPTPAHVSRLEDLVLQVEHRQAGPDEVLAVVDGLLASAEQVAHGFQQQVVSQARRDPDAAQYARFFQEQMDLYVDGLATMRLFAEDGREENLSRGLEACRTAGAQLMALQEALKAEG